MIDQIIKQNFDALLAYDEIQEIQEINGQASDRKYFRIILKNQKLIATYSENVKENECFFYISKHFENQDIIPNIIAISANKKYYLQTDVGTESLYEIRQREGCTTRVYDLCKQSLKKLAKMQILGHQDFDYTQCFSTQKFDKQTFIADLYYFKFCFVDALGIIYDKQKLANDFDTVTMYLESFDNQYFMYRDFQMRNIQVQHEVVRFIDFQGAMQGSITYDVASFLWQSRANLPLDWKHKLLETYLEAANKYLSKPLTMLAFNAEYDAFLLIRFLQVLGAYGFRGLFERKKMFLESIFPSLENIQWFLEHKKLPIEIPELYKILFDLTTLETRKKITQKINSFE